MGSHDNCFGSNAYTWIFAGWIAYIWLVTNLATWSSVVARSKFWMLIIFIAQIVVIWACHCYWSDCKTTRGSQLLCQWSASMYDLCKWHSIIYKSHKSQNMGGVAEAPKASMVLTCTGPQCTFLPTQTPFLPWLQNQPTNRCVMIM